MSNGEGTNSSKGGRVLLFASLAINLFLFGLLIGAWSQGLRVFRPEMAGPVIDVPAGPEFNVRRLARSLPEETRLKLQAAMRAAAPDFRQARRDAIEARRQIYDALNAETFDQSELDKAFAATRAAEDNVRKISHGVFYDFAVQLDDEERALLVRSLEDMVRERVRQNRPFNRQGNNPRPRQFQGGNGLTGPPPDGP